ncbi:MAG: AAA family ATPase [Phycisphaerae bacterium]|nr:AAA family ATPase [Phycisphaerae bacterium]
MELRHAEVVSCAHGERSDFPNESIGREREAVGGRGGSALESPDELVVRVRGAVGVQSFDRYFASGSDAASGGSPGSAGSRAAIRGRNETGELVVAVSSRFLADWYDRRFGDALRRAIGRGEAGVRFEVREPAALPPRVPARQPPRDGAADGRRDTTRPTGRARVMRVGPGLSAFEVGPSNHLAHAAAVRVLENATSAAAAPDTELLYLHGPHGCGKSHLAEGVADGVRRARPGSSVVVMCGEQFVNEFVSSVVAKRVDEFRRRVRRADVLVIDDLEALAGKRATQVELLHAMDAVRGRGGRVVLTAADDPRAALTRGWISAGLASRCGAGMVARIGEPDGELRVRLASALAARRGLVLEEPAARALASSVVGGARELEGAVTRLDAVVRLVPGVLPAGTAMGVLALERALRECDPRGATGARGGPAPGRFGSGPRRAVRLEEIIALVTSELSVSVEELTGRGRHERIVLARASIAVLARRLTTLSYPDLARGLGRPSHSTFVTAVQRLERSEREGAAPPRCLGLPDATLGAMLNRLRAQLSGA